MERDNSSIAYLYISYRKKLWEIWMEETIDELYCTKFQGGDEEGNHWNLMFSMSSDDVN